MLRAPRATRFSQHELLENEIAFAIRKWSAAGSAGYFAVNCFGTTSDFDEVIQRFAVRAREGFEQGWPAASHFTPPFPVLVC
jgi:hypothetical protein